MFLESVMDYYKTKSPSPNENDIDTSSSSDDDGNFFRILVSPPYANVTFYVTLRVAFVDALFLIINPCLSPQWNYHFFPSISN